MNYSVHLKAICYGALLFIGIAFFGSYCHYIQDDEIMRISLMAFLGLFLGGAIICGVYGELIILV